MKNSFMYLSLAASSSLVCATHGVAESGLIPQAPHALAAPLISCDPQINLAWKGHAVPSSFDTEAVNVYRNMVQTWVLAYQEKVEGANNSLVSDLSRSSHSCLRSAKKVKLETAFALKSALKDCVFTSINAYSGPAVSPENQDALADAFVKAHGEHFQFRKLVNASLLFDPIEAFNTKCVLEVRSQNYPGYRLYLAGYTFD